MKLKFSPCARGCVTDHQVTIAPQGCGSSPLVPRLAPVPGHPLVVKDSGGAVISSGNADSSGNYTLILPPGSYTANVGGGATRYAAQSQSFTVSNSDLTVNVFMTAATGYACCSSGGPPHNCGPWARNLTLTDGNGTWTMTVGAVFGAGQAWGVTYQVTKDNCLLSFAEGFGCGSALINVTWVLDCLLVPDGVVYRVQLAWAAATNCGIGGQCADFVAADSTGGTTASSLTFDLGTLPCPSVPLVTGTIPGTIPCVVHLCNCNPLPASGTVLTPAPGGFLITE